MRPQNCWALTLRPLNGAWWRAIQPQFVATALATSHTRTIASRFSAASITRPGFELLYLAEDQRVALFEVQALLGSLYPPAQIVPNPAQAWITVNVSVNLSGIADLCRIRERRLVHTSTQELTGDWRAYLLRNPTPTVGAPFWTNVPTQRLGAALEQVPELEGFTTYSAKVATRRNLVVFPKKLLAGSKISLNYKVAGRTKEITIAGPRGSGTA